MCLLTYFPRGAMPDIDALTIGAINNADGHGYAIVDEAGGKIIVRKSMDADMLIEEFESLRTQYPDGAALFHSRIGTGGLVNKANCHPFKVGSDPRVYVAHNGIMPKEVQPIGADPRSDTRIFAETHLPYRNLNSGKSRRKLGKWLGTDKIVVLSVHPDHNFQAIIINEDNGHWHDGIWYSNGSYKDTWGRTYRYVTSESWKCQSPALGQHFHYTASMQASCKGCIPLELPPVGIYDDDPYYGTGWDDWPQSTSTRSSAECIGCKAAGSVSRVTLICTVCLTCNECGGVSDGAPMSEQDVPCMCYIPANLRHRDTDRDSVSPIGEDGEELSQDAIREAVVSLFGPDNAARLDAPRGDNGWPKAIGPAPVTEPVAEPVAEPEVAVVQAAEED